MSSEGFGVISRQSTVSRDIVSKPEGHVYLYDLECDHDVNRSVGGKLLDESKRWVNDRKVSRNLDDTYFELVKARGGYANDSNYCCFKDKDQIGYFGYGKRGVEEIEVHVGNHGHANVKGVSPLSKREKVTPHQDEFSDAVVVTMCSEQVPICISNKQAHKKEVALSSMAIRSTALSMPYPEDIAKLPHNSLVAGPSESLDANRETVSSECLKLQQPGVSSHSLLEDLGNPKFQFPILDGQKKENATPIVSMNNTREDILDFGNIKVEKIGKQTVEEKQQFSDFLRRSPTAVKESNDHNMKDDLFPEQNYVSCPANGDGVTTSDSNIELFEVVSEAISHMSCLGITSEVPENLDSSFMVEHGSDLPACTSSIQHTVKDMKSDNATEHTNLVNGNVMVQPSHIHSKIITQELKSSCSELNRTKNQLGSVIPRTLEDHSSLIFPKSKTGVSSTHNLKPRTWHRRINSFSASLPGRKPSVGTFPPKRPFPGKNIQNNSYVLRGNSLVRKAAQVSVSSQVYLINQSSLGLDEFQKNTIAEETVDVIDKSNILKMGVINAPMERVERQTTPPLPIDNKSEENRPSPSMEPLSDCFCESALDPTIENQAGPSDNGEIQVEAYGGNMSYLNAKRIVYLKRKLNQLAAASNSSDLSVSTDGKAQTAASDGYYKRSKNQLVRTTFKGHINQIVVMAKDTANSPRQGPYKVLCNHRFNKKQSHKDDESLSSASIRSRLGTKRAYTPRRLIIGNDEYVQIGNGNELITDQKKQTRMLANQKVRWSLRYARQRLARKQFCQFYTRFGKCDKDDGKCPYIHDSSKITVCTKFLNGLCPIPNCKLTHKVIPERMPDCSYFLQGLCVNGNCPYRHVKVNSMASICEGFLRGYCANGNECRKKHSYICPTFEATGTCTQGTKCKFHHPKKQSKGKKKRSGNQRNSGGRYFGSMPNDVSEPEMMVALRQCQQYDDGPEGEVADYVNTDGKTAENISRACEQASLSDSDPMDLQMDNLDQLIKPVRIMKKNLIPTSLGEFQETEGVRK